MIAGKDWRIVICTMDKIASTVTVSNVSKEEALKIRDDVTGVITGRATGFAHVAANNDKVFSVNREHVAVVTVERMPR